MKKTIPNKQATLPEKTSKEIHENPSVRTIKDVSTNRYTNKYFSIQRLIQNKSYREARVALEEELYAEDSLDKKVYTSLNYIGYLDLYSIVLRKLNNLPGSHRDKKLLSASLDKFYDHFLKSCLGEKEQTCDQLRYSLSKEASVAHIVLMLIHREHNTIQKMKLLGVAFEVSREQRGIIKQLEENYLQIGLEVLDGFEKGQYDLKAQWIRRHRDNILSIINKMDWSRTDMQKISHFELIRPWEYSIKSDSTIEPLRRDLFQFLPIYIKVAPVIRSKVESTVIKRRIDKLKNNSKDLDLYPAYEGLNLDSLTNYSIEVLYFSLGIYLNEIGADLSKRYMISVVNKESFMDECFSIFKLLIRWDLAQLSIYSTESLHQKLSQEDNKTTHFVNEVLNWSKKLNLLWSEFHTKRSFFAKSFLTSHASYSKSFDEIDVQNFFISIDRNILRTTVYPNMLAFAFYMEESESSGSLHVARYVDMYVNKEKIMADIMTGTGLIYIPWFKFTNSGNIINIHYYKPEPESGPEIFISSEMLKSEMYDALYYFFATKTFQVYEIHPDDFLLAVGRSFMDKSRRGLFEKNLVIQKTAFLHGAAPSHYLKKWCKGLTLLDEIKENPSAFDRLLGHLIKDKSGEKDHSTTDRSGYSIGLSIARSAGKIGGEERDAILQDLLDSTYNPFFKARYTMESGMREEGIAILQTLLSEAGSFEQETIPFYSPRGGYEEQGALRNYVTPSYQYVTSLTRTDYFGTLSYANEDTATLMDRYRLELEPIVYSLNQYVSIVERLGVSHPQLGIDPLSKTKEHIKELDFLKMSYLGLQKLIARRLGHCAFIGEKEAKRRAMDLAFAHADYFSKIVHPLMVAVKDGSMNLDEVNLILRDFHGNWEGHPNNFDRIAMHSPGNPTFLLSRQAYMLRTRSFLISGIEFDNSHTGSFYIPPIVGRHLNIPIPVNFMDDSNNNPYFDRFVQFHFEEDPFDFARSVSNRTTDKKRSRSTGNKLTRWDYYDTGKYLEHMLYRLQHEVTMLQVSDRRYIDVKRPECLDYDRHSMHDCIITEEKEKSLMLADAHSSRHTPPFSSYDLMNIVDIMGNLLKTYALDERQSKYMELINSDNWIGSNGFHTIVKVDLNMAYDPSSSLYELTGLFDIIYQMIQADYLGSSFRSPLQGVQLTERLRTERMSDQQAEELIDISCKTKREGCIWMNEHLQARGFFLSKAKEPKFLFNYDVQIIDDAFKYHKSKVLTRYNLLMDLEARGEEFIEYIKEMGRFEDFIQISLRRKPSELLPLSPMYLNNQDKFDRFFKEETEGFFLKDHNWSDWLIQ